MVFMPALPLLNSAFDLITVTFISTLIILSVLSLCFIFHLNFKSKSLTHLQGFNSIWTVRFLLVLFIFFWAITELLRIPFFRRRYLYPFLPSFSISQQTEFCKLNIFLSLGFFEPAFLVTLLFLLSASIKNKTPNDMWAVTFVSLTCLPVTTLQGFLIYFIPLQNKVPVPFRQIVKIIDNGFGNETVLCGYPFLNSVTFAAFGIGYCFWFLFSCWRVLTLVINKSLRVRIYALATTILFALPLQIMALGLTTFFKPDDDLFGVISLLGFLGAFSCAVSGEGILVIKPISDALDAGVNCSKWGSSSRNNNREMKRLAEENAAERRAERVGEQSV